MKAVRFHHPGDVRLDDLPDPRPGRGEVLLRVEAVGICGTDTHIVDGEFPAASPVVLGHEICATVVETGTGVTELSPGDLVTVEPHRYCGSCAYCRLGAEHLCLRKEAYGVHLDGGMAELAVVPARVAYPLPPGTPPEVGAMTEPVACCLHSMDRLAPVSGLPVLVFGCGPAGAIMIALARLHGLHPIVAVEGRPGRRKLAERMGADLVLDPADDDYLQQATAATGGLGFPFLIDAVGSPAILENAINVAARGARILVFGVAAPDAVARIRPQEFFAKELTLLGSVINPYTHHRAVGMLPRLGLDRLEIATFPLHRIDDALHAQRTGAADKIQIHPHATPPH